MERKGDWMQTYTGRQFWPLDPHWEEVDIEDIAHSLSAQVRYTGHAPDAYTIAQHSVLVSRRAEQLTPPLGDSRVLALWGLLHDASEAYLVDVARPVKRFLANYLEIEAGVMKAVCERFDLPLDMPPEVKRADDELLATEARDFFPEALRPADWHLAQAPLPFPVVAWTHRQAEVNFWHRWGEIWDGCTWRAVP
jgi:hypothetical protein